jgi:hypothetical protein
MCGAHVKWVTQSGSNSTVNVGGMRSMGVSVGGVGAAYSSKRECGGNQSGGGYGDGGGVGGVVGEMCAMRTMRV